LVQLHGGDGGLTKPKWGVHIHALNRQKFGGIDIDEGSDPVYAGVVHEDLGANGPQAVGALLDRRLLGEIGDDPLVAGFVGLGRGAGGCTGPHNPGALGPKRERDRASDSPRCASDESGLSGEPHQVTARQGAAGAAIR